MLLRTFGFMAFPTLPLDIRRIMTGRHESSWDDVGGVGLDGLAAFLALPRLGFPAELAVEASDLAFADFVGPVSFEGLREG